MYLSKTEGEIMSSESSGSFSSSDGLFSTTVFLSSGEVLINIVFIEDECKGNESTIWTACLLDICCMLSNVFPSLRIVSIFPSLLVKHCSLIFLKEVVIVLSLLVMYELTYFVVA